MDLKLAEAKVWYCGDPVGKVMLIHDRDVPPGCQPYRVTIRKYAEASTSPLTNASGQAFETSEHALASFGKMVGHLQRRGCRTGDSLDTNRV